MFHPIATPSPAAAAQGVQDGFETRYLGQPASGCCAKGGNQTVGGEEGKELPSVKWKDGRTDGGYDIGVVGRNITHEHSPMVQPHHTPPKTIVHPPFHFAHPGGRSAPPPHRYPDRLPGNRTASIWAAWSHIRCSLTSCRGQLGPWCCFDWGWSSFFGIEKAKCVPPIMALCPC